MREIRSAPLDDSDLAMLRAAPFTLRLERGRNLNKAEAARFRRVHKLRCAGLLSGDLRRDGPWTYLDIKRTEAGGLALRGPT